MSMRLDRRRVLIIAAAAALAVACLLLVLFVLGSRPGPEALESAALQRSFLPRPVNQDELFLGDEPDWLPPVLLYRSPVERWTAEDAEPFWTDPAEEDGEYWRRRLSEAADSVLEAVP